MIYPIEKIVIIDLFEVDLVSSTHLSNSVWVGSHTMANQLHK
jgi:hypothetical protein